MGLDDDDTIAERYGTTETNVTLLRTHPASRLELEMMRQELEKNGRTFRFKNANMAHVTLDRLFKIAMDPDTATGTLLQIHDRLVKHGELEPKPNQQVQQVPGQGFQINIVMGSQTVSLGAEAGVAPYMCAEAEPNPAIAAEASRTPETPAYLIRAAMQINNELTLQVTE